MSGQGSKQSPAVPTAPDTCARGVTEYPARARQGCSRKKGFSLARILEVMPVRCVAAGVLLSLLVLSIVMTGCGTGSSSDYKGTEAGYEAGLTISDFEYEREGGERETVTAAVWYPTDQGEERYVYHGADDYQSELALDAPIASGGPFPLVLFAHGGFGCGLDSAFFLEYLARHGYIVVAPDYVDTRAPAYEEQIAFARIEEGNVGSKPQVLRIAKQFVEDMSADREFFLSYLKRHRFDHTSFVVDRMLELNEEAGSFLHGAIDTNRVGACGHSEGGLTVLGKIGAHPDGENRDARIKAALLFSSTVYPFEDTIGGVGVPIMLMTGDDDASALHPEIPRRAVFYSAHSPRYYAVLKDATHFAFSNSVCGDRPFYEAVSEVPQASAICRYGLAFFEKYLRDSESADGQLMEDDKAFTYYIAEPAPGEVLEWGKEPPPGESGPGGIWEEWQKRR